MSLQFNTVALLLVVLILLGVLSNNSSLPSLLQFCY